MTSDDSLDRLRAEVEQLRAELAEAHEALDAIRRGEVDALVVPGPGGQRVLTFSNADAPYRIFVEEMNEGAVAIAGDRTIMYGNRRFGELVKLPLEEVVGSRLDRFVGDDERPALDALLEGARAGRSQGEIVARDGQGAPLRLKLSMSRLPASGASIVCVIATDLAEAKRREQELREAHAELQRRLAELARSNQDLSESRAAALNMMEDAVDAKEALEAAYQKLREAVAQRQRADEVRQGLQAQLLQAQKMESVGRLAGGVAHDFNNMLSVILGHAEMALADLEPTHPLAEPLQEVHRAAMRSGDLTRQLLAFSRQQTVAPQVLDLNDTVAGMLKMLRRLLGEDIELVWIPAPDLWPVKIDPAQLDQILANLLVNSRDAIEGVGRITIHTANRTLDDAYCARHVGAVPGEYVMLAVSDTGTGMTADVLEHVFEPFFTTKPVGRGTGLGLATVYGIVKQNDGYIDLTSTPAHGTTFETFFPRCAEMPDAPVAGAAQPLAGHGETVLFVEDEPAILKLGAAMLRGLGYEVLTAATPGEALEQSRRLEGALHLLITDVVMPEMNGRELAERMRLTRPDLKCLFISGYTADVIAHRGVLQEGVQFLEKPFSRQRLAQKVREALQAR